MDLAMPQPIPRGRRISFDFRPESVLQRPTLAPYIAGILSHWNEIESRSGVFLAALLGGEAQTVIKIFLALQTDGGRKAIIDTVTKLKLPSDDLEQFQEIQRDIGSRYAERNKAVHGAWGISDAYPKDLLWYDPRDSVGMFPGLAATPERPYRQAMIDELNKTIRIYTEADFKDILTRFKCTQAALEKFTQPWVAPLFEAMNK